MSSHVFLAFMSASLIMLLAAGPWGAVAAPVKISARVIEESKPSHDIKISYPATGVSRIDAQIAGWAQRLASDFRRDVAQAGDARGALSWSSELSYEVKRNDGAVLSLLFTHYTFTGGAHPNSSFRTFHFLLPDGHDAEIGELFSARGIRRISDISINELKERLGGRDGFADEDWIRRGAGPNPANFVRFVLRPERLIVYFDAYQVAAYAAGPQEVTIPLARLRDTMRMDPRAPAASFDCARARSEVEIAICGSSELARQDRRLSEAYQERLTWAENETRAAASRAEQRAWLRHRDATCKGSGPVLAKCLTGLYQSRLAALADQAGR